MQSKMVFLSCSIAWWKSNHDKEKATRKSHYESFLKRHSVKTNSNMIIGEIGGGPFGGIIEVCELQAKQKVFIDFIMDELKELNFIKWPDDAVFINSPAEKIDLPDNYIDLLLSYNCIDHGWNIEMAIRECIRVSKKTILSFDCRADWDNWKPDKSHYQYVYSQDIYNLINDMPLDIKVIRGHTAKRYKSPKLELVCDKEA